jgi:hypothetical protein
MVDEGILRWDAKVIVELRKRSRGGEFQEKQLHLVGYLFELCYDLALSPNDNVSQNPGFETFIGEFGNKN